MSCFKDVRCKIRRIVSSPCKEISVSEAQKRLIGLDEELDPLPIGPSINEGRYMGAMMLALTWSESTQGLKTLYPVFLKILSLRLFK